MRKSEAWLGVFLAAAFMVTLRGPARSTEKFRFQLGWIPNARHLFAYLADVGGLYQKQGLDVEFLRGAGGGDLVKKIGTGAAEAGENETIFNIEARTRGVALRVIAVIAEGGLTEVVVFKKSGIRRPKDLEGRTACDSATGLITTFPAFAARNGIADWKVKTVAPALKTSSFLKGHCDFMVTFTTMTFIAENEAKQQGEELVTLLYSDYGVDFYGTSLVALDSLVRSKPGLIRRFVRASLQGLEGSLADPKAAVDAFLKKNPTAKRFIVENQWRIFTRHIVTPASKRDGLGWVDPKKMDENIETMTRYMKLPKRVPAGEMYTNEFVVPKIYPPAASRERKG